MMKGDVYPYFYPDVHNPCGTTKTVWATKKVHIWHEKFSVVLFFVQPHVKSVQLI